MSGGAAATLLADIGGTFARFRVLADGAVATLPTIVVAEHPTVEDAIVAALAAAGGCRPTAAVLATAGPVVDGRMHLTNAAWEIDSARIAGRCGFDRVRLVNDFAAVAWSLPALEENDVAPLGGGTSDPAKPRIVLGPGTGLGAAAWLPDRGGVVVAGEAGHASLAAANAREDAVVAHLRGRFAHVSVERAVSGPGLVNLHDAIAAIDGVAVPTRSPSEISAAALDGTCGVSRSALDMFCAMLGDFAGDLALAFGARGGIYLGGGIAPRLRDHLSSSPFRERLTGKGRLRPWIETIPVWLIVHPDPAFLGLAHLACLPEPADHA